MWTVYVGGETLEKRDIRIRTVARVMGIQAKEAKKQRGKEHTIDHTYTHRTQRTPPLPHHHSGYCITKIRSFNSVSPFLSRSLFSRCLCASCLFFFRICVSLFDTVCVSVSLCLCLSVSLSGDPFFCCALAIKSRSAWLCFFVAVIALIGFGVWTCQKRSKDNKGGSSLNDPLTGGVQ